MSSISEIGQTETLPRRGSNEAISPSAPQTSRLLGHLPAINQDPLAFFAKTAVSYGDIVPINLVKETVFMINKPEYIKHIFQDNQKNYRKSNFYEKLRPMLGEGIFLSDGENWLKQRRVLQPGFSGAGLRKMTDKMVTATDEMLDRWQVRLEETDQLDIAEEMMRLTLDVVLRTLMTVELKDISGAVYVSLQKVLQEAERRVWAITPVGEYLPTRRQREFRKSLATINRVIYQIIDERRSKADKAGQRDNDGYEDLLAMLLDAYDGQNATETSRTKLRDECISILTAGHETTANSLTWMWSLLSKNPDALVKAQQEVKRVLGGRKPTFDDLKDMEYLSAVFEETMRLYPPVWTLSRTALEDDWIGDQFVAKGQSVMACTYAVQRNSKYWINPEGFDPQRFLGDAKNDIEPYSYFPFGGGGRICIGKRFAQMEGMIIMSMILQKYSLELLSGAAVEPHPMITLRPRDGLVMKIRSHDK